MSNAARKSTTKRLVRILIFCAIFAGIAAIGSWMGTMLLPLQMAELSARLDLWRHGVSTMKSDPGDLRLLHREVCRADRDDCKCVVLIHGAADTSMTWKRLLMLPEGEIEGWSLFAFDLPGAGGSPAPADSRGLRAREQARTLAAAMKPLCPRWSVVGNSFGGWVATWVALEAPDMVERLVLISSAGIKSGREDAAASKLLQEPTVESLKEFQRRAYFKPRELPDHVWEAAAKRARESKAADVLQAQTDEDYLDGPIHKLQHPLLLVWGDADRIIPPSVGRALAQKIPGSRFVELPQCGHLPQKECTSALMNAIRPFVNGRGR